MSSVQKVMRTGPLKSKASPDLNFADRKTLKPILRLAVFGFFCFFLSSLSESVIMLPY